MLLWTWVHRFLFESMLLLILGIHTEVDLLDPMVILCLLFWGTVIVFSTAAAAFQSISNAQGFQCLHISTNTVIFCVFFWKILSILMGVKWYLLVDLICIPLTSNDIEYLFLCFLASCVSSLPIFESDWYVYIYIHTHTFVYSGYSSLIRYMICKYFLPFWGLSFRCLWFPLLCKIF